jgi:hypothetical protein
VRLSKLAWNRKVKQNHKRLISKSFFSRQFIEVKLVDSDSYEKDLVFYVEISDPQATDGKFNHPSQMYN